MLDLPPLPPCDKQPSLEALPAFVWHADKALAVRIPHFKVNSPAQSPQSHDPYQVIHVSGEYVTAVHDIIATLAKTNLLLLWGKEKYLRARGAVVSNANAHPLKFFECILRDPMLKRHLRAVRRSPGGFKWSGLLWEAKKRKEQKGAGGALDGLAAKGEIEAYLPGFVKALQAHNLPADLATVRSFVEKQPPDWEGMLDYLMRLPGESSDNRTDLSHLE